MFFWTFWEQQMRLYKSTGGLQALTSASPLAPCKGRPVQWLGSRPHILVAVTSVCHLKQWQQKTQRCDLHSASLWNNSIKEWLTRVGILLHLAYSLETDEQVLNKNYLLTLVVKIVRFSFDYKLNIGVMFGLRVEGRVTLFVSCENESTKNNIIE